MVAGAADLMSRRGVNATSIREVVRQTDTPRGSIAHHFPRGKQQLLEEALAYAGREVSEPLEMLVIEHGAAAGLNAFIDRWRNVLERTQYDAGCPVVSVAVEQYIGEDGLPDSEVQQRFLRQAHEIFETWQQIIAAALRMEGLTPARARRFSALIVSSVEGTVALCRAARSSKPLNDVQAELELLIHGALQNPTGR